MSEANERFARLVQRRQELMANTTPEERMQKTNEFIEKMREIGKEINRNSKRVKVTYFKPSGKYYTTEYVEISSELNGYDAMFKEMPKHHRIKDMFMLIENSEPEGEEIAPYIVPHLFHPKEPWK